MHVISDPIVFDAFGSETSWSGLSIHAGAHGELGETWIARVKSMSMNSDTEKTEARMAML